MPDTDAATTSFLWAVDEGHPHARRGHAYLFVEGQHVRLLTLHHAESRTPAMVERLRRWQAAHPDAANDKIRHRTYWKDPSDRFTVYGDLGPVERALRGRTFEIVSGDEDEPPAIPEAFLRAPVHTRIEAALPGVTWPQALDATAIRFGILGPICARDGDSIVVCAARYGTAYESWGQDRTAAVFLSRDAGAHFDEVGWNQQVQPKGQTCWPPETIRRARFDDGVLVVEWEDPWIDWEPGYEWRGTWDPDRATWDVRDIG